MVCALFFFFVIYFFIKTTNQIPRYMHSLQLYNYIISHVFAGKTKKPTQIARPGIYSTIFKGTLTVNIHSTLHLTKITLRAILTRESMPAQI